MTWANGFFLHLVSTSPGLLPTELGQGSPPVGRRGPRCGPQTPLGCPRAGLGGAGRRGALHRPADYQPYSGSVPGQSGRHVAQQRPLFPSRARCRMSPMFIPWLFVAIRSEHHRTTHDLAPQCWCSRPDKPRRRHPRPPMRHRLRSREVTPSQRHIHSPDRSRSSSVPP